MNPQLYQDTCSISQLPKEIAEQIQERGLVSGKDNLRVSFCGIVSLRGGVSVFMPRSIDLESVDAVSSLKYASALLKAVELYGRQSKTAAHISDEGEGREGLSTLSLIRQLFNEYRQNGLYSRRRVISRLNSGKPNWKATIAARTAFPTTTGQPVYLDIDGIHREKFEGGEVSRIHAHVIRGLDERYSWIFTGNTRLMAPELRDIASPAGDSSQMRLVLRRELRKVYSDNDIRLIKCLIAFLEQESGAEEGVFISGLKSFHYAWEHMLSRVLAHQYPINSILPAPSYRKIDGEYEDALESAMRTDISLKLLGEDILAIVDAKYYAAMTPRSAPGWPDLVKQFFYEKALKLAHPSMAIRNAFVFPGIGGPLGSVHLRSRDGSKFFDAEFPPIHCHYVDPLAVIHNYISNKKMLDLTNELLGI